MPIPALTKSVNDLTIEDIHELVSAQITEGESVEFKRDLSTSGQSGTSSARSRITEDDKKRIIKEIVAFANAYGGRLFLGVAESTGEPPIAHKIMPLPDCAELANRFARVCGDSIDPPMVRLSVRGIETDQDGSGVVVFDVPSSTRAPHMSKRDHRSYRRRGSESVPMDMRDIQDMTLRSANRFDGIETEFMDRRKSFESTVNDYAEANSSGHCFRFSFVPLDDIDLVHVHNNQPIAPRYQNHTVRFVSAPDRFIHLVVPMVTMYVRPIIRGTKLHTDLDDWDGLSPSLQITVCRDGGIEMRHLHNSRFDDRSVLPLDWLVNMLSSGLSNIERIRNFAGLPALEYGLEAQLSVFGEPATLLRIGEGRPMFTSVTAPRGDIVFPRYQIGTKGTFDQTVSLFLKDFYNYIGQDWDEPIVVEYKLD